MKRCSRRAFGTILYSIVLASACGRTQPVTGNEPAVQKESAVESLTVQLDPVPVEVTLRTLPAFTVRGVITNRGTHTIDTQAYASELLVDGQPSMAWSMAIGNGAREPGEEALSPGESVIVQRIMGSALFATPGDYVLVLRVRGVASPPVTIHVSAEQGDPRP